MSQSPFSKVIMPTQSLLELQMQANSIEREADTALYDIQTHHMYYKVPEYRPPHYCGKGHSTKYANNNSSLAHTKKRKAKRRLNKKHNRK